LYAPEPVARDYHSVAILLPDGSVLSGGGEVEGSDSNRRKTADIYKPPYLFNANGTPATQPTIYGLDNTVAYGQRFAVILSDTTEISSLSLIRPSSVTHGFNQEQRFVSLALDTSYVSNGKRRIEATAPAQCNLAPTGNYLLFPMTSTGVPGIAGWISLGGEVHSGTLSSNQTWAAASVHFIAGDLTVPQYVHLTINSGATVYFADGTELIVDGGTLTATSATFKGTPCSLSPWDGIRIKNGTGNLTNCTVEGADVGIAYTGGTGGGTVSGGQISNFGTIGLVMNNNATITATGVTVNCDSIPNIIGIQVGSAAEGTNTISRCVVNGRNVSGGKGILVEDVATLLGNSVLNVRGNGSRGIQFNLAAEDTNATVVLQKATNPTAYSYIFNCGTGVYVSDRSRPTMREVRVDSTSWAFWVTSLAQPDIGISETQGNSDVTRSSQKHVRADTRLSSTPNIDALYNWWGTSTESEISSKMSGSVNWQPYLSSDPNNTLGHEVAVEAVELKPRLLGNTPNPFSGATRIHFVVPEATMKVSIHLFSITGRLVRTFEQENGSPGERFWEWDGLDSMGQRVSSGIYYYRISIGPGFSQARKLLVLR
jgi:flagellar hook assembly protein FlgD